MNRKLIIGFGLLILVVVIGIAIDRFPQPGYVLFIYKHDASANVDRIVEYQSGFSSLQSCQERGKVYESESAGVKLSYYRCVSGCPLFAQQESDCKNSSQIR